MYITDARSAATIAERATGRKFPFRCKRFCIHCIHASLQQVFKFRFWRLALRGLCGAFIVSAHCGAEFGLNVANFGS